MSEPPAPNPLLTEAIEDVLRGKTLGADRAQSLLGEIMAGRAGPAQTAGLLIAMRAKGETADELVGFAREMRRLAERVECRRAGLIDTAGTGGGLSTYNVSTAAAFVAAAAGCPVAKHGNRSATSKCGSADVLEALGAAIDLPGAAVTRCIEELGIGFMFAPLHHPATRHVVPVRRELAVRTVFNFLGPLTNPAGAERQLIGVPHRDYQAVMAAALAKLGCRHGLVVSSQDGLDELSVAAPNHVVEIFDGRISSSFTLDARDVGLERTPLDGAMGGGPDENALLMRRVLSGERGPARSLAVLNAGAAIYVGGRATGIAAGVRIAEEAIDSAAAAALLDSFVRLTSDLAASTAKAGG